MNFTQKSRTVGIALYLIGQIFFLINIQFPRGHSFDEFHYVPSAKQFLEHKLNQNWEHPPLGKLIMAAGIGIWGDRPIGWRFMSTVFGALTLVGIYALSLVLFKNIETAIWVALITLFNQLLYVQSRIGMLDTFMFTFLIWAMVGYCAAWDPQKSFKQNRRLFLWTGTMLGLSTACKWFAIIPWVSCCLLILLVRLLQRQESPIRRNHSRTKNKNWYSAELWKGICWTDWVVCLIGIPILVYCLTYIPYFFIPDENFSFYKIFTAQPRMWDGQLRVISSHPYMSHWTDWPTMVRPIWYAFDREGEQGSWVRGVLLLGNPLIMWSGILAVLFCAWDWVTKKDKNAFLIFFFYSVYYFSWAIIPRKIFFYYYYYPAGMLLGLALAYVFNHPTYGTQLKARWSKWVFLGATVILFVYFFPILAALKIPSTSFRNWMWFPSWI